ncbi:MAG: zf-HC2 domain-containing protein [Oscillospiraceae bacterium]
MLPCHVVQDLLPLYLDDLASAETKALLEEHLAGCESCRAVKEQMEKTPPLPKAEPWDFRFLKDALFLRIAAAALALLLTFCVMDLIYHNTDLGYGAYSPEQVLYDQLYAADPADPDYRFTILTKEKNEETGVILLCSRWEDGSTNGIFWHRFQEGIFGGYSITGMGFVEGPFREDDLDEAVFYSDRNYIYSHEQLLRGDFVEGYLWYRTALILMAVTLVAGLALTWHIARPLFPRRKRRGA